MLRPEHCYTKKRSKSTWQKKENVSNAFIVKEIGVQTGVGIAIAKELM